MERMKPIDLERVEFRRAFRGYERGQVDALLQRAADEMATLLQRIEILESTIERQTSELETFRAQETVLKEAILLAQRAADETRANAHKEAALILEEARNHASTLDKESRTELAEVRWEIERLRLDKQRFINGFRNLLENHMKELIDANRGLSVVEGEAGSPAKLDETAEG